MASLEARKAQALRVCRDSYGTHSILGVRELCDCLIEEKRDELEKVKPERFQALQGKILGLRELLEEMTPRQNAQAESDEN
ncbi:MAG: hypothetical protein RDU24_11675 [Humidesulfovibrio sp.]|uniref:hypothetical protein n=1 Tax=Humidesulfovibrio sp. TaxID=2910988 RepID=UPI0027FA7220|nr:hypothetical protein [Humidesulfovibrio sp.]MDQ7836032.1 hypothetical protein [Humidesulfovibrio sp.]